MLCRGDEAGFQHGYRQTSWRVPPAAERRQPGHLRARPDGPLGLADSCEAARMARAAPRPACSALPQVRSVATRRPGSATAPERRERTTCIITCIIAAQIISNYLS
jgi:hypothetical protein